jgi:large subunit ribosomal protein L5
VPKLKSITINMSFKHGTDTKKLIESAKNNLELIAAQKPCTTFAKKAIAGFKIRAGFPIGLKVTLRRDRMYEFLDRLMIITLPRSKDLKAFNVKAIDQAGNLNIGIKDYTDFIEVGLSAGATLGMNISFTTYSQNRMHSIALFKKLGFPIYG